MSQPTRCYSASLLCVLYAYGKVRLCPDLKAGGVDARRWLLATEAGGFDVDVSVDGGRLRAPGSRPTSGPKSISEAPASEQHPAATTDSPRRRSPQLQGSACSTQSGRCGRSDGTDVGSLRAFRALRRAELDPLTFVK